MSAREEIAARLWMSVPSADNDEAKARTEEMLDAHRAEVLNEAADMVHAMADPQCTCGGCDSCAARGYAKALREKAAAGTAPASPDESFFVPGRVYTHTDRDGLHLRFFCEHLTTDPKVGDREAWGWLRRSDGTRRMLRAWRNDLPTWTPEAGGGRG